jgi:tetratricopeptide (TPR) repeat protein
LDILAVARKYHTSLLAEDPDNTPIREQAVLICKRFAMIKGEQHDWNSANAAWSEAADHVEAMMARPDGARHRDEFVSLMAAWAEPLYFHSRFADAIATCERGLPVARELEAERPDDLAAGNGVTQMLMWRGNSLWRTGRWPAAAADYREGLATIRRLNPGFGDRFGVGVENNFLCRLSEGHASQKEYDVAEKYAREAVELVRAAVARRPADGDLTVKLGANLNILGRPLFMTKQWQAAADAYRESNRLFLTRPELTVFAHGGFQGFQRGAAAIARCCAELGRPDDATADLVAAVRLPTPPVRAGRMNPTPPELFENYLHLIETALRRSEPATARKLHSEAIRRLPPPEARTGDAIEKWAKLLTDLGPKLTSEPAGK